MIISKTINEIRSEITKVRPCKVAFVPTMGSLHQGHLELVKQAKKHADIVVVSIFVNKAQFNDPKDYNNYPRNIDKDAQLLQNVGATHLFTPFDEEMLPSDLSYKITSGDLVNCLCGSTRPGHFDGVSLILTKFFNIINPDFLLMGKKDFQQYLVVQKLVKDLNYKINVIGVDAVREESGLVMSSRNERLSEEQISLAKQISICLEEIRESCLESPKEISKILQRYKNKITAMGFGKIDYLEVRREKDLALINTLEEVSHPSRIFIAVYLDQIRLIDNVAIS